VATEKFRKWKLKMDFENSGKLEFFDENGCQKAVTHSFLMYLFSSKLDKNPYFPEF